MAIPINEVTTVAEESNLYPQQFIHLSDTFHDSYFYNRGVRLVGTIGCGCTHGDEKLKGNVSTSDAILTDAFGYYLENGLIDSVTTKMQFINQQVAHAKRRKEILLNYLDYPRVSYPIPNAGGGTEVTTPVNNYSNDHMVADAINIYLTNSTNDIGYGGWFSPADCPIVSIVATKKSETMLGMYHFGYIPVYEGVGNELARLLYGLKRSNFELSAFISAGARIIEVYGERAERLLSAARKDDFLSCCITVLGNIVSVSLQNYARAICREFIPSDRIEVNTSDTIAASNWYSQRAGSLGQKPNGRNAQILCLLHS